jgi:hypothetical protein
MRKTGRRYGCRPEILLFWSHVCLPSGRTWWQLIPTRKPESAQPHPSAPALPLYTNISLEVQCSTSLTQYIPTEYSKMFQERGRTELIFWEQVPQREYTDYRFPWEEMKLYFDKFFNVDGDSSFATMLLQVLSKVHVIVMLFGNNL